MSSSSLQRWVAGAAFAGALALANGSANAVVYSSVFDPPNFSGVATFDVSDACLAGPTGFRTNNVGGCVVTWLSATVTFTDLGFTFDYSSLLSDSGIVSEIWVQDGELGGIRSGALGPRIVDPPGTEFDGPWWIQYEFEPPSPLITALDGPPSSGEFGLGVVYLYTGTCTIPDFPFEPVCFRNQTPSEEAQVENFTRVAQVPEPGTLILALAGLIGAGLARRRRNA